MVLHSGNGWLGNPYLVMCGWELEVTNKFKLRSYAVTPLRVCYCINKCTRLPGQLQTSVPKLRTSKQIHF